MRLLLDSCRPHRLRLSLAPHDVQSAKFAGLDGLLDRELLEAIEGRFDVLLACDQNLQWQQRVAGRPLAVVLLRAVSNRLDDLLPLVARLLAALGDIRPGQVREIG